LDHKRQQICDVVQTLWVQLCGGGEEVGRSGESVMQVVRRREMVWWVARLRLRLGGKSLSI